MADFYERFINGLEPMVDTGSKETPDTTERINNGNGNRSGHARLHQSFHTHREYRPDLPRCGRIGSRRDPDPVHPRHCRSGIRHLRRSHRHDRRAHARAVPVTEGVDNVRQGNAEAGEVSASQEACSNTSALCSGNGSDCIAGDGSEGLWNQHNVHRLEHAGFHQPVNADRKHRGDLPGRSDSGSGSNPNTVHSRNRGTGVLDIRCSHRHDRRVNERTLQVTKSEHFGSFQAPILLILLVAAFIIPLFIVPVFADVTVSFSPLNLDAETLMVHNSSGTLIGVYNTSTKGIVLTNNESYSILVQPESSNLLVNHPDTWFSNVLTQLQAHAVGLTVALFFVIVVIMVWKRR